MRARWPLACGLRPPGPPRRLGGVSAAAMVLLHVKRGDESQFLLQAPGSTELEELTVRMARVYNARLKVQRVCSGEARRRASLRPGPWSPSRGGPGRGGGAGPLPWGRAAGAASLAPAGWPGGAGQVC